MPPMDSWGLPKPKEPELSGSGPISPKSAPAYCDVLPEMSMTKTISTLGDRPKSVATLPLINTEFCSWVMREPSFGERIWTLGSAAHTPLE